MSLPSGSATGLRASRGSLRLRAELAHEPKRPRVHSDARVWFNPLTCPSPEFCSLEGLRSRKTIDPPKSQVKFKGIPHLSQEEGVTVWPEHRQLPLSSLEIPLGKLIPPSLPGVNIWVVRQSIFLWGRDTGEWLWNRGFYRNGSSSLIPDRSNV